MNIFCAVLPQKTPNDESSDRIIPEASICARYEIDSSSYWLTSMSNAWRTAAAHEIVPTSVCLRAQKTRCGEEHARATLAGIHHGKGTYRASCMTHCDVLWNSLRGTCYTLRCAFPLRTVETKSCLNRPSRVGFYLPGLPICLPILAN